MHKRVINNSLKMPYVLKNNLRQVINFLLRINISYFNSICEKQKTNVKICNHYVFTKKLKNVKNRNLEKKMSRVYFKDSEELKHQSQEILTCQ